MPEARDVAARLVRWADVIAENFTPHVMRKWGLDYESVRTINPRIVYLSASMAGQYGPYSELPSIGNIGAAMAGFTYLVGWPDRRPTGPAGAYTDYVAAKYITVAILATLEQRERSGEGQYIDLAQFECSIHFLAPAYLDLQANGRVAPAVGNRSHEAVPHGAFRCQGTDRWVAIAVEDNGQWVALTEAIGRDDLARDPSLLEVTNRRQREDDLEAAITDWTLGHTAEEAEALLVARGVPAHAVLDSAGALADRQLAARRHFLDRPHPVLGEITIENARFHLMRPASPPGMAVELTPRGIAYLGGPRLASLAL